MRKFYSIRKIAFLAILGVFSLHSFGQTVISDEAGLVAISGDLSGSYQLSSDIVLTSAWTPIANFTGTLDGNGHIISGLTVNNSGSNSQGLFASTNGATIKKLGIEDAKIVANNQVGAIVGIMQGGIIQECYVANSYIEGNDHVGSIAGQINTAATLTNSYSTATVYTRNSQSGGLVGVIKSSIVSNSYFSGVVEAATKRANGIVGLIDENLTPTATVENCINLAPYLLVKNTSNVYPSATNGHFRIIDTGSPGGTLSNNYSLINSKLGTTYDNAIVVATDAADYGLTGKHGLNLTADSDAKTNAFYTTSLGWDFTTVWKMLGDGYPVLAWQTAPVKSSVFRLQDVYIWQDGDQFDLNKLLSNRGLDLIFSTTSSKINIVDGLATVSGVIAPETAEIVITTNSDFTITNNTLTVKLYPAGAIQISSTDDLNLLTLSPASTFELTGNIDMTGVVFNGFCSSSNPFTGVLDGKGFVIKGLSYSDTNANSMAFIRESKSATIKNLGIENANIVGRNQVGIIVGIMSGGTMEQCYLNGSYVEGNDHVGALTGQVREGALIQNCYASAEVKSRATQAGGLSGTIKGANTKISKSYFTGTVTIPTDKDRPAGIVALVDDNKGVTIEYCVNLATSIIGGSNVRIVHVGGNGATTTMTSNYSLSSTQMNGSGGTVPTTDGNYGADKMHGENIPGGDDNAKTSDFYVTTLGWDFTDVWMFDDAITYPVLKVFDKGTVSINTDSSDGKKYHISTLNNTLLVDGLSANATVVVWGIKGEKIASLKAISTSDVTYNLPQKGVYIVQIMDEGQSYVTKVIGK